MADRIAFPVFDSGGNPKPDATPSFLAYKTPAAVPLTAPAIVNLGGGVYGFTPTDANVDSGTAYLISTGAFPPFQSGAVFKENTPFLVANYINEVTGALWAGAAPTVGRYVDFAGLTRASPTPTPILGAHLFAVVPTLADIVVGTAYRLDAAVGASPDFISGSFFPTVGAPPVPPVPDPLTGFEDFENTIQAIVVAATGFVGSKVIWADQTRDRPARPFVELAYVDESTTNFTEDSITDTVAPPAGQEITLSSKEHGEPTIQVRVFSSAILGSQSAKNIARKIRGYFGRESVQTTLGDIALVSRGSVQDISIVLETEHEGRAILDLKFRVARVETETTTFIEVAIVKTTIPLNSVDIENTLTIDLGE